MMLTLWKNGTDFKWRNEAVTRENMITKPRRGLAERSRRDGGRIDLAEVVWDAMTQLATFKTIRRRMESVRPSVYR